VKKRKGSDPKKFGAWATVARKETPEKAGTRVQNCLPIELKPTLKMNVGGNNKKPPFLKKIIDGGFRTIDAFGGKKRQGKPTTVLQLALINKGQSGKNFGKHTAKAVVREKIVQ